MPLPLRHWTFAILLAGTALGIACVEVRAAFTRSLRAALFGDLEIYQQAVRYWTGGGRLYEFVYVHPVMHGYGFTYPPFAALLFIPMAAVHRDLLAVLWTVGTLMTLAVLGLSVAARARRDRAGRAGQTGARPYFIAVASLTISLLLLSYPVLHNIGVGQISVLITALAFVDAAGVIPRRWRGILIGLAAAIKLTPLTFIAYFLVTRQWRAAAMCAGVFGGATGLAFLLAPRESVTYWGDKVLDTSRVGQEWWARNKSILGFVSRWELGGGRQLWVWLALCAVVTAVALLRARTHFLRNEHLEAAVIIGCLSVAVTPISWPHHQSWAMLASAWLIVSLRPARVVVGTTLFLVFFLYSPLVGLSEPTTLIGRVTTEIPTAAFVAICLLGLPHVRTREIGPDSSRHDLTPAARPSTYPVHEATELEA